MKTLPKRSLKAAVALGVVSIILCTPIVSLSWGPGGHMMVAKIAFDRLNPHAKAEVKKLLAIQVKVKLLDGTQPKLSPKSKGLLAAATAKSKDFVNAAHWPDDLRSIPEFNDSKNPQHDFGPLHFIDQPFSDDGTALPPLATSNILKALEDEVNILKTSTDDNERAQALRFLIHFVGDVHQPLHCATRVSKDQTDGDHGGNFVFLTVAGHAKKVKLHSYWDGGLDSFPPSGPNFAPPPLNLIPPAAAKATNENPATDPKIKLDEPFAFQAWADESFDLAKAVVYHNISNGSTPKTAYINNGRKVARQRVAWAGYRLAALLNAIWP